MSTAEQIEGPGESIRDMVIRYAQKFEGPVDIAAAIVDELSIQPDGLRTLVWEMLPGYCGRILGQQRRRRSSLDVEPVEDEDRATVTPLPARSAKAAAIRAWFPNFLASQLHVEGEWKRLGDCTKKDLMFSAVERRNMASKTIHQANELEALAVAMDMHNKKVLRDLPESVVRSVLAGVR